MILGQGTRSSMSQLNIWGSQIEKNVNLNLKKSRAICPPGGGGLWDEEGREAASPPGDPPSWPQIFNRSDQDKECQVCLDSFCRLSRSKVLQKDSNPKMHSTGTADPGQAGEDVTRALPPQWGPPLAAGSKWGAPGSRNKSSPHVQALHPVGSPGR